MDVMRCYCCDKILTTQQATRKFSLSGVYTEMCDECLNTIELDTEEGEGIDDRFSEEDTDSFE